MASPLPPEVGDLLGASDEAERDRAWTRFVETHSRLLLHVARSVTGDADDAMDAYAWVLEHLREGGFRRLTTFRGDGNTRFTTWLVVVARRGCLDFLRHSRGRARGDGAGDPGRDEGLRVRRRLLALGGEPPLSEAIPAPDASPADDAERSERTQMVQEALGELSARDRLLLSLRFEDELSAPEIARVMDFPTPFHVYRRLNLLLPRLRERLNGRGIEGVDS